MRYWLLLVVSMAPYCTAADWQATAAVGFGQYHPVTFSGPAGTANAGIGARYVLNAAVGRAVGERFAVEAGWLFQDGDFEIASGGTKTAFDANAHAVYADLIWHVVRRTAKLRPFFEAGSGAKFYRGIEKPAPRPLAQFGSFRDGIDARPMLTYGGGLEWAVSRRWAVRVDLRDCATPFPTSVIVPASGGMSHGWLHDFVSTIGVTLR